MAEFAQGREYADGEYVAGTPYRIIRLLGAGGMGCVYEVEHVELLRRFVLKSLLKSLAGREDLIARMRNEWRALGRLSHENIVDVVNAGMSEGAPYYVMELLVGETLSQRIRRLGKLPVPEAVRIAVEILHGLSAAHEIGVVHRDVKPANVFITEEEVVKVLDFGIAKCRDDSAGDATAQGLAIGTPRYMSPEQVSGDGATPQSDLYAVGLLLFEMIAGRGPFDHVRGQTAIMMAHLSKPPASLAQFAELPEGLEAVVAKALAKLPRERPSCAKEMAESLARWAGPRRPGAWRDDIGIDGAQREKAAPSSSMLRSDEPTVAQDIPLPEGALPSSPTEPDSSREDVDLSRRSATELIVVDDSLRDAPTRTSHRLLAETPSHVHSLTPLPSAPVDERRAVKRLFTLAALVALGLGAFTAGARVINAGESLPEPTFHASSPSEDSQTLDEPSVDEEGDESFAFEELVEEAGILTEEEPVEESEAPELAALGDDEPEIASEPSKRPTNAPDDAPKRPRRRSLPSSGL